MERQLELESEISKELRTLFNQCEAKRKDRVLMINITLIGAQGQETGTQVLNISLENFAKSIINLASEHGDDHLTLESLKNIYNTLSLDANKKATILTFKNKQGLNFIAEINMTVESFLNIFLGGN